MVKHWRIANSLKNDRVKPLSYPDVAKCIWVKANRSYTDHPVEGCKTLYEVKTGIRLESSWNPSGFPIEENRKERNRKEPKQVDSTDWFQKLWEEYPENRRGRKAEAKDAYSQCIPDDKSGAQAFENLTLWKQSEQWAKDAGQYVPYLSNWIVRGTWAVRPAKLAVPTGASGQLGEAAGCPRPELTGEGLARLRRAIRQNCRPELDFLRSLPHILETEHLIFVQGGVPSQEHMERLSAWHVMKNDEFMSQSVAFQKYCVVGHWPVTLYDPAIPCARPRIDRRRHIVSIDGGCALQRDAQLNALVLPQKPGEGFSWFACDGLPTAMALDPQEETKESVNVRWGHSQVEVLLRGGALCRCRHLESGRQVDVLTDYLYRSGEDTLCKESTDYRPAVEPGDILSIVRRLADRALVKKNGVTGWYFGRLCRPPQK